MTVDQIMTKYLNMEYDELVNAAKNSLPTVVNTLTKISDSDRDAYAKFLNIIGSMISADGMIVDKERRLYNDLFDTDLTFDQFFDLLKGRNDADLRQTVDDFLDAIGDRVSTSIKTDFLIVLLCFACIDEKLTADEKQYFKKLLA